MPPAAAAAYAEAMEQHSASNLAPGMTARVELTVTDGDTAQAMGSGDVPVLGTPRVLALAEAATVAATAAKLPAGSTTVGTRVELEHSAPSPVGTTVTANATLAKVDGRRLLFEVRISAGERTIAEGRIERALVDRQQFVNKAFGGPG
jgi:fluoroacetyl-CoA thioesterase